MTKVGKRLKAARTGVDREKSYAVGDSNATDATLIGHSVSG